MFNTAKHLKSAGHSVGLLQLTSQEKSYDQELKDVFDYVETIPLRKTEVICNLLKCLFNHRRPFQVGLYQNRLFSARLSVLSQDYDVVIANHVRAAEYAKPLQGIKKILDMHDAISYTYQNTIHHSNGIKRIIYRTEHKRLKAYERDIVNHFDRNIIISPVDKAYLEQLGAGPDKITIVPVAVRDDIAVRKSNYLKDQNKICFLGKMSYQPNEDAVLWFCRKVFPRLKLRIPELIFYIIGIEPTKKVCELAKTEGIIITGFVENPFELISRCIAMVAPIRSGAGMQNKVLESMLVGTPTVISSIAAEGLEGIAGRDFLLAERPEDYLEKILTLYHDPALREKIGQNGQQLVENKYSWKVLSEKWVRIIQSVAG
nr:glycosyltransferase family 4 protein [Syntrophobotulus glycolicus]